MSLENGKWRIPRGDARSIEETDTWIGEMGAIGWINGKVQSVGTHDDTVMACFPAGSLVTTRRGMVPIEQVVVGDWVLTHVGRWRQVTECMSREFTGELAVVKPAGIAVDLRMTPEHPIYSAGAVHSTRAENWRIRPQEWQWTQGGQLRAGRKLAGDYVLGPTVRDLNSPPPLDLWVRRLFPFTFESGLLVGLFLAEGSPSGNHSTVQFALHAREDYIVAFLEECAQKWFSAPLSADVTEGTHGQVARFSSAPANALFRLFGSGSAKALPWEWLSAPALFRAGVLRGWLIGDGSRKVSSLRGVSCSRNLIEQMRLICSQLGVRAALSRFSNENPSWQLDLDEEGTAKLLAHPHAMEVARWGRWDAVVRHSNGRTLPVDLGLAHRVASVGTAPFTGRVFNLEVDEDHSYCVEGVAVHNCWMANAAVEIGGHNEMPFLEGPADAPKTMLNAPPMVTEEQTDHVTLAAERMALAAIQDGRSVEGISAESYHGRIRAAIQDYAGQCLDNDLHNRAAAALAELQRLDGVYGVPRGSGGIAPAGPDRYGVESGLHEGAPLFDTLE